MFRVALLLALSCALPAVGQRAVTLGDRVRIEAPRAGYRQVTGDVVATTPDVLSLSVDRSGTEVAIPRAQIDRLLVSVDTRRHVARGTVVGAVLGAGVALWFGPRKQALPGTIVEKGRTSTRNVVVGSVSGAALGALVGYFAQTDSWIQVSPIAR